MSTDAPQSKPFCHRSPKRSVEKSTAPWAIASTPSGQPFFVCGTRLATRAGISGKLDVSTERAVRRAHLIKDKVHVHVNGQLLVEPVKRVLRHCVEMRDGFVLWYLADAVEYDATLACSPHARPHGRGHVHACRSPYVYVYEARQERGEMVRSQ